MSDTTPKAGEYWIVEWVRVDGAPRDVVKAVSWFDGLRYWGYGNEAAFHADSFRFILRVDLEGPK
jgi:hypothetical protein